MPSSSVIVCCLLLVGQFVTLTVTATDKHADDTATNNNNDNQAPEGDRSHVTPYVITFDDEKQFEEAMTSRADSLHFVMFYAPWCHHCKMLSPTFNELGLKYNIQKTSSKTVIAKVDCTKLSGLCRKHSIKGFPTLLLFSNAFEYPLDYGGSRSLQDLVSYVEEHSGQGSTTSLPVELDTGAFEEMSHSGVESIYFVLFYSPTCEHCHAVMPVWNDLAKVAHEGHLDGIIVSQVSCEVERDLCLKESVFKYPAVTIYKHGKRQDKYEGPYDVEMLKEYATSIRMQVLADSVFDQGGIKSGVELNDQNIGEVMKSGYVFINFFKPWCNFCQALAPKWTQLAEKFAGGRVVIASVDCSVHDLICNRYNIVGYPSMILFHNGKQTIMYTGVHEYQLIYDFVAEMTNQKEL